MMIYFKAKPEELMKTLEMYDCPRRYLMVVSSYKAIHGMNITNVSEVSFNCQAIKGSHRGFFLFHPWKAFE